MVGDGQPRRIAIIGTGLAGLATAHFLQKANESSSMTVEVYLFERNGSLGMDSESVTVDVNGESRRVDVPMRAFSKGM
ncbi:hypothetical protein Malapachy_4061 [Malassezia pachydermatis]|uniref:Uncharacterized protein n=1 Tax=Malassezia pachydermatis TaxID=77020 RepID=A0A0M8MM23_9BASI|nr:hypothetical protein Malapachy_4061 [Malassezia pachydermatis]KOS14298.1 hypothetical protein Malapachy_4061 [Malassezia pachydermatis]